jgi:hypothetical protein
MAARALAQTGVLDVIRISFEANPVPYVAATAAIIVFVLRWIVDASFRRFDRINLRKRLVIGLCAEIDSNLKEIIDFVDNGPYLQKINERIRRDGDPAAGGEAFRPSVTITESSRFFAASASMIPELKTDVLFPLMEFYRFIEELESRRDAFESKAFTTISIEGRIGLVDDLLTTGKQAKAFGQRSLTMMERVYPRWYQQFVEAKRKMPRLDEGGDPIADTGRPWYLRTPGN